MTAPRGRHVWTCPSCGRACRSDAGWKARRRGLCLQCTRDRNGWKHDDGCPGPSDHAGACRELANTTTTTTGE